MLCVRSGGRRGKRKYIRALGKLFTTVSIRAVKSNPLVKSNNGRIIPKTRHIIIIKTGIAP